MKPSLSVREAAWASLSAVWVAAAAVGAAMTAAAADAMAKTMAKTSLGLTAKETPVSQISGS